MTNFRDLPDAARDSYRERVHHAVETTRLESNERGERALKYLFAINGGSAVALLAFMGASEPVRNEWEAWIALAAFALGLLFLGICQAIDYHSFSIHHNRLELISDRMLNSQISVEEYLANRGGTDTGQNLAIVAGYISWGLWVGGVIFVAIGAVDLFHKFNAGAYNIIPLAGL